MSKLNKDICRVVGHEETSAQGKKKGREWFGSKCTRCNKVWLLGWTLQIPTFEINTKPAVKYADITVRRYKMFGRTDKPQEP